MTVLLGGHSGSLIPHCCVRGWPRSTRGSRQGQAEQLPGMCPKGPWVHNAPIEVLWGGGTQGGGGRRDSSVTPGLNPCYLYPALLHTGAL